MWRLDGTLAHLQAARICAHIDLARPNHSVCGLQVSLGGSEPLSIRDLWLFGLAPPQGELILADCYCRGTDLVASFQETELRPCVTQVYWRVLADDHGPGLEVIVSAQTPQWNSLPGLSVVSIFPRQPAISLTERAALWPVDDSPWSLLLLAHPSNLERVILGRGFVSHDLFPGQLEKGVIRRARLRAVFVPQATARRDADRWDRSFLASPPPLTT